MAQPPPPENTVPVVHEERIGKKVLRSVNYVPRVSLLDRDNVVTSKDTYVPRGVSPQLPWVLHPLLDLYGLVRAKLVPAVLADDGRVAQHDVRSAHEPRCDDARTERRCARVGHVCLGTVHQDPAQVSLPVPGAPDHLPLADTLRDDRHGRCLDAIPVRGPTDAANGRGCSRASL